MPEMKNTGNRMNMEKYTQAENMNRNNNAILCKIAKCITNAYKFLLLHIMGIITCILFIVLFLLLVADIGNNSR